MNLLKLSIVALLSCVFQVVYSQLPWSNGRLEVSPNGRYLRFENGKPFFWLGDTGWLLAQRLNRDEVDYYLSRCKKAGFNIVQIQVMNSVPAYNIYGMPALVDGFDFSKLDENGYNYWKHIDYIVRTAEQKGIYIGMVCAWGSIVKNGSMDVDEAKLYGRFLAERYRKCPNIVWIMGGDIRGDINPEVWNALAGIIKSIDKEHLMTFHPFGRTMSATWFHEADWLDFNMFQSGHRRYGQRKGDGDYTIAENTEEDNWRYVQDCLAKMPGKPVLDGEPVYEDIPQGLHDVTEVRWKAGDVRRYAYWSLFAGSFGHTYGHNSIMQFYRYGYNPGYGAVKPWFEAMDDPGYNQMKYLKELILKFPFFERVPDQSIIAAKNGGRYDRLVATRGRNYLLVYNYSACPMKINLTRITGNKKKLWWFDPRHGRFTFIGLFDNKTVDILYDAPYQGGRDMVLVAVDAEADYKFSND